MSDEQETADATAGLVARWLALEQIFSQNGYEGGHLALPSPIAGSVSEPTPGLLEITGSTHPHVVVTAAHATNHERAGSTKVADRGTGGLAILLAQLTGCTALVALSTAGDANYDEVHPLKERLADLRPTVVIDLHGMRSRTESDVDLGTGGGLVPATVIDALDGSDLRVTTNEVFDAMRPTTVTSFAQSQGIRAVQVEIGAHLRPPSGEAPALGRLIDAVVAAIEQVDLAPASGLEPVSVKIASGLPTAVVHPSMLPGTDGPVPVTVVSGERTTVAWAWSAAAAGIPERARHLSPGQVGVSRRLRVSLGEAPHVSVRVPQFRRLHTFAALVDDMPGANEVQVCPTDMNPGTYLLVQGGVTAWVSAVPRDHVRPGTVRLAYQLRLLIASDGDADNTRVVLVAAAPDVVRHGVSIGRLQRSSEALDRTMERLWRALFRAPEFSARVVQAHAGDDAAPIVTLHPAVFDRIGIESGQQVLVRWGGREVVALAVADHDPPTSVSPTESMKKVQRVNRLWPDLPEGISAHVTVRMSTRLRDQLGAPVATVISVRRRMRPVLVRNLNSLVVPLASLVLAGAALPDPHWPTLGLGTALMSVFALARLRIPQPRSRARVDEDWVERMAEPVGHSGSEPERGGEKVGG
ncbi:hypothetical protein ACFO6V_16585 [Promicromonospora alba]|uniref:Uncharacterized protein n=1 Tax=Promicromonospora alba TaxID=1616110 RepID=A0ABV9HHX2_9MICO